MISVWRRWCPLLAAIFLLALPARAGDRALIDFIGYSEDLRYLAFEQYGELDGVELAYSDISIIDLTTGEFAGGSPFHKEADENAQQSVPEIRAAAAASAKSALADLSVTIPVEVEALSGDPVGDHGEVLRPHRLGLGDDLLALVGDVGVEVVDSDGGRGGGHGPP